MYTSQRADEISRMLDTKICVGHKEWATVHHSPFDGRLVEIALQSSRRPDPIRSVFNVDEEREKRP